MDLARSAELNVGGDRQASWSNSHEVDLLIWQTSSALHDLQAALADIPAITETQLNDLRVIVQQSQSALSKGLRAPRRTT